MKKDKVRLPWWFWLAATGMLSFVPLFLIGYKFKNWFWVGLASWQLLWLWLGLEPEPESREGFESFMWFSVILAVYVFVVVRKRYLIELEIESAMNPSQQAQASATSTAESMQAWSCTGCGAENNNRTGICEYCGVAAK